MSGHSKWNNIKRKKGAADAAKGKIFTKLGREIQMAVRSGSPDPNNNHVLADAIAKAKANNMPNDSIQRSIQKAIGGSGENYEDIYYEGYGPGGVAVMVKSLTDNRNRTAGDLRYIFDRSGGNLGTSGSVGFLFERKGSILLDKERFPDEETVMMEALDAGADDVQAADEYYEVVTAPESFDAVKEAMSKQGYAFEDSNLAFVPLSWVKLSTDEEKENMQKLLDSLDDNDDVNDYWHNWEQEEEE